MGYLPCFLITLLQWSCISTLKHQCSTLDTYTLQCDFIPKDIPYGFTSVNLIDFNEEQKIMELNSSYFMSKNWENVRKLKLQQSGNVPTYIVFEDKCLHGLKSLMELHINLLTQIVLDADVFIGLDNLTLLDMSECVYLGLPELVTSLRGVNKLPNLQTLKASELSMYNEVIQLDTDFAKAIGDKQISTLHFSDTNIKKVNVTSLLYFIDKLKNVNFSNCKMSEITLDNKVVAQKLENIHTFDMSYSALSWFVPSIKFVNMTWYHSHFPKMWNYYIYPQVVNMSFCIPSVTECFPNIVKFDLSNNKLGKMAQNHHLLFQKLFQSLSYLKDINLSFNQLNNIPEVIFINNRKLEVIDCSHNELEQVSFTLKYLSKLKVLNLQFNRIKILNTLSINLLNSLITGRGNVTTTLYLGNNPLSCSKCEAKQFLYWLIHTNSVNISSKDLTCIVSKSAKRKIDDDTFDIVNNICKQKTVIISTTTSVAMTILIAVMIILIMNKRRKNTTKRIKRRKLINKLKEGLDQNEFVAFLSHSSEDKDFVDNYVTNNLNENLQNMTGIDRNLVCTGDRYLRPGFMILNETTLCIERASAFIVVVSDNYNLSAYCNNELDLAYHLNKPIIPFIKGLVDETLMMPIMKSLFKRNVRVLWAFENQEYIMKTTWENVCASILDLITLDQNI